MSHLINIVKDRNEKTLPNTSLIVLDCLSHLDRNQESWCLGDFNQESISLHKFELDQYQSFDKLASFSFNEIELDYECEPDLQPCDSVLIFKSMLTPISLTDLDSFPEPTLIPIFINLETEPLILDSHISLMGKEFEFHFFDLDPAIEPIPTLELSLDFSELVMILEPITLEPKSTIPPSHILLLDISINHDDSMMIFQDWSCKENSCMIGSFMIQFILGIVIINIKKRSIKMGSVNNHIILIG